MATEKAKASVKKTTKKAEPAKKAVAAKKVAPKKAAAKPAAKAAVKKTAPAAKKAAPKKAAAAPKVEKVAAATSAKTTSSAVPKEAVIETAKELSADSKNQAPEYDLQELLEAGCHFGHQAAKWHPKMAEYIYGEQAGIHIFDLVKTAAQLTAAYNFVYNLAKEGKSFLMVGTKRQAGEIIRNAAQAAGCFHITSRWMGGMLTNWPQISKSIKRMNEIEDGLKSGKFDKYTKYERLQLEKEQGRLERFFSGLKGLNGKPDCIFVVDPGKEAITIKEANMVSVPVIALTDSNADPRPLDLVIPANDDAVKSIKFIVDQLAAAYSAGRAARS